MIFNIELILDTTCSTVDDQAPLKPQETNWATRAPVAQTLQTVRQTCPRTTATCAYMFVRVSFSGKFNPTRASSHGQRLETTT